MTTMWWEDLSPNEQRVWAIPMIVPVVILSALFVVAACLWVILNIMYLPMSLLRWFVDFWFKTTSTIATPERHWYE